jgi:predicted small lipoprotein YifL
MNPRRLITSALLTLAALAAGGCRDPLFMPDDERSQYDRYDTVRNQRAPQYIMDEFGTQRPNLRQRLFPKD